MMYAQVAVSFSMNVIKENAVDISKNTLEHFHFMKSF